MRSAQFPRNWSTWLVIKWSSRLSRDDLRQTRYVTGQDVVLNHLPRISIALNGRRKAPGDGFIRPYRLIIFITFWKPPCAGWMFEQSMPECVSRTAPGLNFTWNKEMQRWVWWRYLTNTNGIWITANPTVFIGNCWYYFFLGQSGCWYSCGTWLRWPFYGEKRWTVPVETNVKPIWILQLMEDCVRFQLASGVYVYCWSHCSTA